MPHCFTNGMKRRIANLARRRDVRRKVKRRRTNRPTNRRKGASITNEGSGDNHRILQGKMPEKMSSSSSSDSEIQPDVGDAEAGPHGYLFNPAMHEFLIKRMLREVNKGRVTRGVFLKKDWKNIARKFNKEFGVEFTLNQFKEKATRMKNDFVEFQRLRDHTGFGWNEALQIPQASDEVWARHLQVHQKAKKFRHQTLLHYEDLWEIFKHSYATGRYTSTSTGRRNVMEEAGEPSLQRPTSTNMRQAELPFDLNDNAAEEMSLSTRKSGGSGGRAEGSRRPVAKAKKKGRKDVYEETLQQLSESVNIRTEKDRTYNQLCSKAMQEIEDPNANPDKLMEVMMRLGCAPGVDDRMWTNTIIQLRDPLNRRFFGKMGDEARLTFIRGFPTGQPTSMPGYYGNMTNVSMPQYGPMGVGGFPSAANVFGPNTNYGSGSNLYGMPNTGGSTYTDMGNQFNYTTHPNMQYWQ